MNMIIGMRRKREPPPPSTIHIFDTQLKRKPQKLSLLLDLPAELRNNVYAEVFATTGGVHLSCKGHRRALASSSRLTRVNKQVHDEFTSAAWALANITTQAPDLDFRHIVAFLNRLSDAELFAMPTNDHPVQRKMMIELSITEHYNVKLLRRWLNRIGNPGKKGTDLVYRLHRAEKMALGKRKRPAVAPIIPRADFLTFGTQLKENPSKLSLLLDLPAELRNAIYEIVLASTGGVLLSRSATRRALASSSTMPRVNKQIRDEFLATAMLMAEVHTTSVDFSFRHVVAFLNRLSEEELRALPTTKLPKQRKIIIHLHPSIDSVEQPQYLKRWLNRVQHPTKKGTDVVYEYR
ncbi:hypothetical protein LTR27_012889 [Elasticomyces elasticus]|nr:hypothetical protein LTR27_012889 [Elasticomyces elasticus]